MQRLQLDELPGVEGFDTYKNYPAFLLDMQAFSLETGIDAKDEAIDFQDEAVLSAAAAESEAKAASNLVTLHADSLAVTFEGSMLLLLPLRGNGKGVQTFLLPACIVSMGHARSSDTSILQEDEVILVSLIGGWLHAIQVSRDGHCRTWCRTQLGDTNRPFLSAAFMEDSSIMALVYRTARGDATNTLGYVELLALQLNEHAPEEAKPLWVAHGPHPPHAAHWESAYTGFLVASGGFELSAGDGPTLQTEDAVCTVFRMEPAAQAEMRSWLLPRGDVLSCAEHVSGLEVALAHNSQGALLFRMAAWSWFAAFPEFLLNALRRRNMQDISSSIATTHGTHAMYVSLLEVAALLACAPAFYRSCMCCRTYVLPPCRKQVFKTCLPPPHIGSNLTCTKAVQKHRAFFVNCVSSTVGA
ncbi:unnamed protein product [Symbiodinium necroappetens]|uniref:Uncharacterized protein n=1 Tax=Symbiodinium necroappetens TaxID=1628268 RepID=A0A812XR01_9DINO|nr:unnamed protein product [Symbiodinium necroappetens]